MKLPDVTEISFPIKRATDLSPFTLWDGSRHLGFHYFVYDDETNTWYFRWVETSTDGDALARQIELGIVYIFAD